MDHGLKLLCAALVLLSHEEAVSQQIFKCKDAAARITYAGKPCEELGLISAGEVRDRITVGSGVIAPVAPAAAPRAPVPEAAAGAGAGAGEDSTPAAPDKRCFTVKTAKGTATRCNDVPE